VGLERHLYLRRRLQQVMTAHPLKPEQVGQDFMSIKDTKGKNVFPKDYCDAAKKPSGVWYEYWCDGRLTQAQLWSECQRNPMRGRRRGV
jgi:signal transduction histidine kinase